MLKKTKEQTSYQVIQLQKCEENLEEENKLNNIIEVKGLTKEYKNLKAVDNLSFEVHEGEILGLLRTKWKW